MTKFSAPIELHLQGADLAENRSAHVRQTVFTVLRYALLTVLALFLLFPFFVLITRSFMQDGDYSVLPKLGTLTVRNWHAVFVDNRYGKPLLLTLAIVGFNIIVMPLASSFCSYSFARTKWRGKELVFALMLATMMIPGSVLQVPLYVLFNNLGWLNTIMPFTIPNILGGGAVNIFLFRQFMRGLPIELEEAARIDGANALKRYALVTLPLCKPILIFVAVGAFNAGWSDFLSPLIYMTKESSYTLAVAIYQSTVGANASAINVRMASGLFMAILPAIVFFVFQRNLIDGLTVGAVKG